jgi:hypothetical protein
MPGQTLAFNGFGSFRGYYSANYNTGSADIVIVTLANPSAPAIITLGSVTMSVICQTPLTNCAGYFVEWVALTGTAESLAGLAGGFTPLSGMQVGSGQYDLGTGAATTFQGWTLQQNVPGILREIASGRMLIPSFTATPPYGISPSSSVISYDSNAEPKSNQGDEVAVVLFAPMPIPNQAYNNINVQFAFQLGIQGTVQQAATPSYGAYSFRRANP